MLSFANMALNGFVNRRLPTAFFMLILLWWLPTTQAADLEECQKLFRTGQYQACYEMATKAIEDYAYQEDWRHLLIQTMMVQGRYEEARDAVINTISRYPTSVRARILGYDVFKANGNLERCASLLKEIDYLVANRSWAYGEASNLVAVSKTALHLGADPKSVLESFLNRAKEQNAELSESWLLAGKIALDKKDFQTAGEEFSEGLKKFEDEPDFHWGMAMAFAESDLQKAMKHLNDALNINTNHIPSILFAVDYHIDAENYEGANEGIQRALSINPHSPEAWTYQAVIEHLHNSPKGEQRSLERATRYWKENPEVPHLLGKKLSRKYRFQEGAAFQKKALELDPKHPSARIALAQDLLRLGDDSGWTVAKEAHDEDPYDVVAYNLVTLADVMAKFKTLENDHFIVRMSPKEAAIYGDRVLALLNRAHKVLTEKYGIDLEEKTIIEIFPQQKDFAIRTFSLPGGDGFLGVCFGRVITANSPASQVADPSNWEAVLWHEFAHVITLTLTQNKMPRWLSEGISVHEELEANPIWGQRMNAEYREMTLGGELTPVSKLSSAFLSPETPQHLQYAYYESALVVEYIIKNHGIESLRAILKDLGKGIEINEAIAAHTADMSELEPAFEQFAKARAESLAPGLNWERPETPEINTPNLWAGVMHPKNYYVLQQKAGRLMRDEKWEEAKEPLQVLIDNYPNNGEDDSPLKLMAIIHRELKETKKEKAILNKLAALSADDIDTFERLIKIAEEEKNWKAVALNGQRYLSANPLNPRIYRSMAKAYQNLSSSTDAIQVWKAILQMDPADPAEANFKLASLIADSDPTQARQHLLRALEDAPRYRDAHRLLQKLSKQASISPQAKAAAAEPTAAPTPSPKRIQSK